ncbi:hypothetical protein CGZ93_07295 [Enemella dayhoffiae]|uniref:Uncharacterized protein n=1 Tax=Enemella dayhoffiae TaxID=2016507 RepID=A0A255H5B9_9ACTN|nr:polymorphic toxin type 15 domain-containing protein [Enemella dayhoffiae]OYO22837.1 hypothetical protein CGZ93_07295 [Enemella dayhoffiae]
MGKGKALKGFVKPLVDDLLRTPARAGGRTGREVLDGTLASQRAARRRLERVHNANRLDDLARRRGLNNRHDLPRAPERHTIDGRSSIDRARRNGAPESEVRLQRDAYQEGMNAQTVNETLHRLNNKPSRPSSRQIRNDARDRLARRGERDLIREGYSPAEAREMARHYADETFPTGGKNPEQVTHNPDMHLGGNPHATTTGDGRVNNAFGEMGPRVRPDYEQYLRRQQAAGHGDSLVNVEVIV